MDSKRNKEKPRTRRNTVRKKIFYAPSDPVWYNIILVVDYICIVWHSYRSINGKCLIGPGSAIFYIMDALCFIDVVIILVGRCIPNIERRSVDMGKRSLQILIIELISVLPIEQFCPRKTEFQRRLFCMFRLNRLLKIIRIFRVFRLSLYAAGSQLLMRLVEMYMSLSFLAMVSNAIYCNTMCLDQGCTKNDSCFTHRSLVMFINQLGKAGLDNFPDSHIWSVIACIMAILGIWGTFSIAIGHLALRLFSMNYHQIVFVNRCNNTVQKFGDLGIHIKDDIMNTYRIFWNECRGNAIDKNVLEAVTPAMRNSLMFSISAASFRHSQLLRTMEQPALRHVAMSATKKFLLPGDFIFRRNSLKDKIVYVMSGTVQLLSQIDGESPVLKLGSGSCLGETSMTVSYQASNTVCCETFCEVLILEKKEFWQENRKHPLLCSKIHKSINERYRKARELHLLATAVKRKVYGESSDTNTCYLYWIKIILHDLMSVDPQSRALHQCQNIYLEYEIDRSELNHIPFCPDHLDLLAIGNRLTLDKDTVFIKSNFPCILQPHSIFSYIWGTILHIVGCVAFICIPYMAFVETTEQSWYQPFIMIVTLMFWFDIYIQLSTGIASRSKTRFKFKEIVGEKLRDFIFLADLLSCVPLEVFSPIIMNNLSPQIRARMHFMRLFKLFRIEKMFVLWSTKFNANIVAIQLVKFSFVISYTTYVVYCKCYTTSDDDISRWFHAVQTVTRVGLIDEKVRINYILSAVANIACTGIEMFMYASIAAAYVLSQVVRLEMQYLCSDIMFCTKESKHLFGVRERVHSFINTHWINNQCYDMKFQDSQLLGVSKKLYNELLYDEIGETLYSSEFFHDCPDEMIYEICSNARTRIYPPEEVIIYAGSITHEIYFTKSGSCIVIGDDGFSESTLSFGASVNLLEACFGRPACKTCITRTHCIVVVVDFRKLLRTMRKYKEDCVLESVISASTDIKCGIERYRKFYDFGWCLNQTKTRSFYDFGYNIQTWTLEEFDYYLPFDRLHVLSYVRYFLLRSTILPEGTFLYTWECLRCVFAVLTAFLYFLPPLFHSKYWKFLGILDAAAICDIYVRLHVCYYNKYGLLIKHPTKTAVHYLKSGFLFDLLAIFPFAAFQSNTSVWHYANRLIQMHRYMSFFLQQYASSNIVTPLHYQLAYLPVSLIMCSISSTWLICSECEYSSTDVVCSNDSLLSVSPIQKPISPLRAHLFGMYVVTSAITGIGLQGFKLKSSTCKIVIMVLSTLGVLKTLILFSVIIILFTFRSKHVMNYQKAYNLLKNYMDNIGVSKPLKKVVEDTAMINWTMTRGRNMEKLIKVFTTPLQSDILYEQYGSDLFDSSVFVHKTIMFYKNLLPHMKHYTILEGGYLETINDITSYVYILCDGTADVIGADGKKLTALYVGSIYGNLQKLKQSRQSTSIIAITNVSVMQIKSGEFHEILSHYPELKKEFDLLRMKYTNYIPTEQRWHHKTRLTSITGMRHYKSATSFLRGFVLIFPCYLGVILELQHFTVKDTSYLKYLYACDLLYALYCAIKYRADSLRLKEGSKKIKVHSVDKWIAVFSLVPIDIFVLHLFTDTVWKYTLLRIFRINRYFRLYDLIVFFKEAENRIDFNLYILRFVNILALVILMINVNAFIIGVPACYISQNMEPHVPSCKDLIEKSAYEKFMLYAMYLHISSDSMAHTSTRFYYPQGLLYIVIFIIIMLISHHLYLVSISQVFVILLEGNRFIFNYKTLADRISYFTDDENVSFYHARKIFRYIHFLWGKDSGVKRPKLLCTMATYLQDAIALDAFSHLFIVHPIFNKCHADCLRQILQKLVPRTYCKHNYITFAGAVDESMYFILTGKVAVMNDDNILYTIRTKDSFGVLAGLYYKTPQIYTFMSLKESIVLQLSLSHWDYLLHFFPASKETIYNAAENYSGL